MCEQALLVFSEGTVSTRKLVAREEPEILVPPPDVTSVTKSLPTNDLARGDALRKYKQKIEDLPEDFRIDKMCSEAGFIQPVAIGRYFVTVRDTEMEKLDGPIACRKYTFPRNEETTRATGWIRENTRIGPVLEVIVSIHQGCHGIEIRINSLSGDGSHSWVSKNKYVTEMSEIVPSKARTTDGGCTGKLVARLRPNQTSLGSSFSRPKLKTETPIHEGKWIDVGTSCIR